MHVVAMAVRLDLPGVFSLKAKRGIIKGLLQRIQHRFAVATAEVEHLDHWQTAGLAFVAVGNEVAVLQSRMQKVLDYIEGDGAGIVVDIRVEFLS
jgi:uncharacterized protein YlxP (DUF503 family)